MSNISEACLSHLRQLEASLLHMISHAALNTKELWIDSGYNMLQTYAFAQQVSKQLNLNLVV